MILGGGIMDLAGRCYYGDAYTPDRLMEDAFFFKTMQMLQTFMVFVVPSVIAACLFFKRPYRDYHGARRPGLSLLLLSGLTIYVSQSFISWSGYLNYQLELPESWSGITEWIEATEQELSELTALMAHSESARDFLFNVLVLAVLPAIGEEWLFRGHLQRYLGDWFRNMHVAIFVTSILFSAMHFQFLTFLPRFFLGWILGYLFYLGKNLWLPVVGHFTNNFMALLMFELMQQTNPGANPFEMSNEAPFYMTVVLSAIGMIGLLFLVKKIRAVMN
jgi:membrane protease YdiL (CAAX protease family)